MDDVDLQYKRVVIRCDLNVPLKNGVIKGDKRIRAVIPTIRKALDKNCAVMSYPTWDARPKAFLKKNSALRPLLNALANFSEKKSASMPMILS